MRKQCITGALSFLSLVHLKGVALIYFRSPMLNFLNTIPRRWMSSVAKSLVVFVLGGPGAGKGTQCARIVKVKLLSQKVCMELNHRLACF